MNTLINSAVAVFLYLLTMVSGWWAGKATENSKFLYPPPDKIEYFTFGFRESAADSFWLRWIQDADFCQTYFKKVEFYPDQKDEGRFAGVRHKNCDNSWSYAMLDVVTRLAPLFKMPYLAGGISLSVLVEDYAGATKIFDRGLQNYPDDWSLAYRAAYHYLFDLKDKKKAAELLLQAQTHGAPEWVNLLASRLYSETGELEIALSILMSFRSSIKQEESLKSVDERIEKLKTELRKKK